MDLNFGYVSLYGMARSVTEMGMSLMCRSLIMIYTSSRLVQS
jgi:hypothetical protein